MLCHACRVHLRRDFPYCLHCGTPRKGATLTEFDAPTLTVAGKTVTLLKDATTIGRAAGNDVVIAHPSVSRKHARILRRADGFHVEDLGSFNGTTVGEQILKGANTLLHDAGELYIGDVPAQFAQPRSAEVGGKTMVRGVEHTVLGSPMDAVAPTATEPLSVRPRRRSGWALKQLSGGTAWVLRNTRTGSYLELDERDVFIWEQLGTGCTVGDLLYAYAERFDELALPRIENTLRSFAGVGLVAGLASAPKPRLTPARAVFKVLFGLQLAITGLDGFFGRFYRSVGWVFFSRAGVALGWLTIVAGLFGFWVATGRQQLFDVGGAGVWGAVAVGAGYLVALVIHESAHALAVKSYGRRVTRAGFMLMLFMPFAFVDTSDMWFGDRRSRVVVSLAGPLSTAALAGVLALLAAYLPDPVVSGVAFQLAFGLYLNTLYNFNPLMPLDGYHILSDLLRMPRLREEATAYLFKGVWQDLRARRRPTSRELGLLGFSVASLGVMALFLLSAYFAWESKVADLVRPYLPPPYGWLLLAGVVLLLLSPVLVRLARRLVRRPARAREVVTA